MEPMAITAYAILAFIATSIAAIGLIINGIPWPEFDTTKPKNKGNILWVALGFLLGSANLFALVTIRLEAQDEKAAQVAGALSLVALMLSMLFFGAAAHKKITAPKEESAEK
jgi:hypothetical protein